MTAQAFATGHLVRLAEHLKRKYPGERFFGIRTNRRWEGNGDVSTPDFSFRFVQCDGPLTAREALLAEDFTGDAVVLVTRLQESELGADLVCRLARNRIHSDKPWNVLQDLFKVRVVSPRLLKLPDFAEAALEFIPAKAFRQPLSGVLDEAFLWGLVLPELGFETGKPDVRDLLEWTLKPAGPASLKAAPREISVQARGWFAQSAGSAGELLFDCVAEGNAEVAVPLGLVCEAVANAGFPADGQAALVRMERFVGNRTISRAVAEILGREAAELLSRRYAGSPELVAGLVARADALFHELMIPHLAVFSTVSVRGYEGRMELAANALKLAMGAPERLADVEELLKTLASHRESRRHPFRLDRIGMAQRLLKFLTVPQPEPSESFGDAVGQYRSTFAWVDRARYRLFQGDANDALQEAFTRLLEYVGDVREGFNQRFGELLANWNESGSSGNGLVLIEEVLERVVVPSAASGPVLVVVVDGMSQPILYDLLEEIRSSGWQVGAEWPVIAALPSVTEVSRASLFSGKLVRGDSTLERKQFTTHPALVKLCKKNPPLLFHKAGLTESGGIALGLEVRNAVAATENRIVAVVVNAVDDALAKAGVPRTWRLAELPVLEQLLAAASQSGRTVILTSDHGHVVEHDTEYRKNEPGERYRKAFPAAGPGEVLVTGGRVVSDIPGGVVLPWSERVRYGIKKYGYHGGGAPQECVVPLVVLTAGVHPGTALKAPFSGSEHPAWW